MYKIGILIIVVLFGLYVSDIVFADTTYEVGTYLTVVDDFDCDAVQEIHTAFIVVGGDTLEINVLSDYEDWHLENTNVVVEYSKGFFTGYTYNIKASNKKVD